MNESIKKALNLSSVSEQMMIRSSNKKLVDSIQFLLLLTMLEIQAYLLQHFYTKIVTIIGRTSKKEFN